MVVTTEPSPQRMWKQDCGGWGACGYKEFLQEEVMLPEEESRGRSKALAFRAEKKKIGKAAEQGVGCHWLWVWRCSGPITSFRVLLSPSIEMTLLSA